MTESLPSSPDPSWEARLPPAQRSINRFCENWLFAFLVAMSIRHIALEAFRIPTASMEPMLYGDPSFTRSDFVLVDKLWFRFSAMKRWDVTVFQFPTPEIEVDGRDQEAFDADDRRIDNPITRPLMYRNFVKRCLTLPGERFYIANGDLFVAAKGSDDFTIARKPAAIQEALWQDIYRHGAQTTPEWYVPWQAKAGAKVENLQEKGLRLTMVGQPGGVSFDQPLRNLYLKPGEVRVNDRLNSKGPAIVNASLTAPLFSYNGRIGNLWRLEEWWVSRMTSADLDDPKSQGTLLNVTMHEQVGDLRLTTAITAIEGAPILRLQEGAKHWVELRCAPASWTLVSGSGDGAERQLASGANGLAGHTVALANIDDQVVLTIDQAEVFHGEVPACDPESDPTGLSWRGEGSVTLASVLLQRDLHYCNNGFLSPEGLRLLGLDQDGKVGELELGSKKILENARKDVVDEREAVRLNAAKTLRHQRDVRAQMLGIPVSGLSARQEYQRIGYSKETAVTTPDHAYLMLGDNSPQSWDGRNWGFVPESNLRGRVVLRARARFIAGFPVPFGDWAIVR